MKKYIGKRLLGMIPVIILLTFFVFLLMYIAPGDPATRRLSAQGIKPSQEEIEAERVRMGLDKPFLERYGKWAVGVVQGDFGDSYRDDMPVLPKLMRALKYTFVLAVSSLIAALLLAFPLALYTAIHKNSLLDHLIRILSFVGNSVPNFLLSVILMYFFCMKVKLFPIIAEGSVQGLFLPTLTLALPMCSRFIRQFRAEFINQLDKSYISGLRARGVLEKYVRVKNAVRNSLSGIITIIALSIGGLMGGSVVIENMFRWPGIGHLVMTSITDRDFPVVQGFVLIMAAIYLLINLITDISYKLLDPRIDL